jgi:UDP:flavonoid glycosyltransferase YjiC (YdhE family)
MGALNDEITVPLPPRSPDRPVSSTVLFYAIDGAGLGHLSRCLSVARHLRTASPFVITTCSRADVLDGYGIPYRTFSSFEPPSSGAASARSAWHAALRDQLESLFDELRPSAVVVDGIAADAGLARALRAVPEIGRVGIRRAYRLDGRENLVLQRDRGFHLLLVPHDPQTERVRIPNGPAAAWVGPLMLVDRDEALPRAEARRVLGLPPDGPSVLVQLGAGRIGRGKEVESQLVDLLAKRGVHEAVTSYDAKDGPTEERFMRFNYFPLAATLAAFDLAVAASGYNTFHELMHHGVPTVFVPNAATISDDQLARARVAERAGAAMVATEGDEARLAACLDRLLEDDRLRERMSQKAGALVPVNGAKEAAGLIDRFSSLVVGG